MQLTLDDFQTFEKLGVGHAARAADLLEEPERTNQLRRILNKCIQTGDIEYIRLIADKLHLKLPKEEHMLAIEMYFQNNDTITKMLALPEPERKEELLTLLDDRIENCQIDLARQLANMILPFQDVK